jgi:hypothetical protein
MPLPACDSTLRERACVPEPQLAVQWLHSCHVSMVQCCGQTVCTAWVSAVPALGLPPCAAPAATLRTRVCVPSPHVVVGSVRWPQPDSSQSTGHGTWRLHGSDDAVAVQGLPPAAAGTTTARVRRRSPPGPQLELQPPKSDHPDRLQSTGHTAASAWHSSVSRVAGHTAVPSEPCVRMVRLRPRLPTPQETEQADQAPKSVNAQSTGQGPAKHEKLAVVEAGQAAPPWTGAVSVT